ncbi:MAG TPA: deoxyribonuclease V [Candidatus Limnocylindrales bacterium]|nr:deoxyribonuclease V [Candidatus Limnocylindrales bacterium]
MSRPGLDSGGKPLEDFSTGAMKIPAFATTVQEARKVQERLCKAVRQVPLPADRIRLVGAADVTYIGEKDIVAAAVVVTDVATGRVVEERTAIRRTAFPYVPGFLTFREGPAVVAAWKKLSRKPDVVLFDGHGIAHPRRLGIASHIGVLLDRPSVGVAKKRLVGEYSGPGPRRGDWSPLTHEGEIVGAVVRTRDAVKPVFVSVGHRVDLPSAISLVLRLCSRYRLPDPARRAHQVTREIRRKV